MRKNIGVVLAVIMSIAMLCACSNSNDFQKSVTDNSTQITEMTTALQDDEIDEVTTDNKEVTDTTVKEKEKTTKQNKKETKPSSQKNNETTQKGKTGNKEVTTAKKVTTTKLTTSKLKEKRTVVSTVSSKTTNKTNKTKEQVSTKFVPKQKLTQSQINGSKNKKTGRKSGIKFSGSTSNSVRTTKFEYSTATATTAPKEKAVTTSTDYTSYPKAVYSKKSKNIFIFGGVLGTIGLVLVLYGVISHSHTKEDDEKIDKS